jgi:non-ribosomal peptide synthetase component F/acyl carrier protein
MLEDERLEDERLEDERLAGAGASEATETAARVREAWAEILLGAQSDGDRPEPEDDRRFLAVGGHSLAAARLIARLGADLGVHLPMSAILLADPTLAELIAAVAAQDGASRDPLPGAGADPHGGDTRTTTAGGSHLSSSSAGSMAGSAAGSAAPAPASAFRSAALSPSLRRLWTWHRLHPESPAYNVVRVLDIHGRIKPTALRAAMADVAARHEALRCSIAEPAPGRPEFVLEDDVVVPLVVELLSEDADAVRAAARDAALQRIAEQPFPMDNAPLWRVGIVYSPPLGHTWLILVMHHLVSDMRAADLVFADLATAYGARTEGRAPVFPAAAPSLFAHLEQESRLADSPRWTQHLDWWSRHLAGARPAGPLPLSAPARQDGTYAGTTYCAEVPAEQSAAVERALSAHALTPAAFFLTAADAVLASWRGRDRTGLIGLPSMRINRPGDEHLVGFLLDTLLLPTASADGGRRSFTDAYTAVRNAYADAADHALPAYDEIAARIKAPRAPGNDNPLIGLWFNDLTQASPPASFGGHRVVEHDFPPAWALFDLGLYLRRDAEGRFRVHLVAPRGTMEHADLAALAEQIVRTAVRAAHDPRRPLGELLENGTDGGADTGIATDADLGTGTLPAVESTVDLVRRHATQRPDAIALADESGTLDYRSLDAQIDELAAAISVPSGRRVVVAVPARRDRSLVLRLLACRRAGATAVLIDAHWPRWRRLLAMQIAEVDWEFPWSGREGQALAVLGGRQPAPGAQAADGPAYVLFTSGTTGDPLAVRADAARADAALADLGEWLAVDARDRVAMLSGPAHDPVLRDLGLALRAGGTVCIPPEELFADPAALAGWLRAQRITVVNATPVMFALLCGADPEPLPELRAVVCGGSPLSPATAELIRERAPHARIVNGYGCTETPQLVVAHEIGAAGAGPVRAGAQVPIGTPLPGRRVELRTEDGRQCDVGQLGELWIADPHIAEGYLPARARNADGGEPGGTGETDGTGETGETGGRTRFVVEPDGIRWLRTGDLARRDASGLVHLAGRRDRQTLVNGFRVALEEIEAAARRHPGVADAVAHVVGSTDGAGQSLRVSVQVTPGAAPSEGELRAHLATVLPPSVVPARILVADRLELSANLKPAAPAVEAVPPGTRSGGSWRGQDAGAVDGRLRGLAEAMLGGPLEPAANFFDAGFTSVSLLQLSAELSDLLGRPIEPLTLFTHPNLAALDAFLFGAGKPATVPTPVAPAASTVSTVPAMAAAVLASTPPPSSGQAADLRARRRNLRAWAHATVPAHD